MLPEEEPVFDTAKERDKYYAMLQFAKEDLYKKKSVPIVKAKPEPDPEAVKNRERKNALKVGKKLELNYKNDYSKKPDHLPTFKPRFGAAVYIAKRKS